MWHLDEMRGFSIITQWEMLLLIFIIHVPQPRKLLAHIPPTHPSPRAYQDCEYITHSSSQVSYDSWGTCTSFPQRSLFTRSPSLHVSPRGIARHDRFKTLANSTQLKAMDNVLIYRSNFNLDVIALISTECKIATRGHELIGRIYQSKHS